jgi:nicotinamide N-methyltransferase
MFVVVELGAGCALPSLLAATLAQPPSLIVVTDYPDAGILGNLKANVERNREHYRSPCEVHCVGYE